MQKAQYGSVVSWLTLRLMLCSVGQTALKMPAGKLTSWLPERSRVERVSGSKTPESTLESELPLRSSCVMLARALMLKTDALAMLLMLRSDRSRVSVPTGTSSHETSTPPATVQYADAVRRLAEARRKKRAADASRDMAAEGRELKKKWRRGK